LCRALQNKFPSFNKTHLTDDNEDDEVDYSDIDSDAEENEDTLDDHEMLQKEADEGLEESEILRVKAAELATDSSREPAYGPMKVLPLYSRLPSKQQLEVFKPPRPG